MVSTKFSEKATPLVVNTTPSRSIPCFISNKTFADFVSPLSALDILDKENPRYEASSACFIPKSSLPALICARSFFDGSITVGFPFMYAHAVLAYFLTCFKTRKTINSQKTIIIFLTTRRLMFIDAHNKRVTNNCVGHKMSNQKHPRLQDTENLSVFRHRLSNLPLEDTATNLDNALVEMAEMCMHNVATAMRDAYCDIYRIHIIPKSRISALKTEAALYFIRHNEYLNERLHRLYIESSETQEEHL